MTHHEQPPEQFPSHEELKNAFEQLLGGIEYKVLGEPRDDLFEIETMENGERVGYAYKKAKYDYRNDTLPDTAKFSASIHKIFYDGDVPVGGECVANYLDGQWQFVT